MFAKKANVYVGTVCILSNVTWRREYLVFLKVSWNFSLLQVITRRFDGRVRTTAKWILNRLNRVLEIATNDMEALETETLWYRSICNLDGTTLAILKPLSFIWWAYPKRPSTKRLGNFEKSLTTRHHLKKFLNFGSCWTRSYKPFCNFLWENTWSDSF